MGSKINHLLQAWPPGVVGTQPWLRTHGVNRRLAYKYVQSGWLERLGQGAYVRAGSDVDWPGAVHTLQHQLDLPVHPGAITAFEIRGYAHYLALGGRQVMLFGESGTRLPSWFTDHQWSRPVSLVRTRVFGAGELAVSSADVDGIDLSVATLERGAFELMYLVPKRQSWEEALQVMESLTTLRPSVVQRLLETCTSVKTKRLFMHAAERFEHFWLDALDLLAVDLGSGKRTIHPGGRLDKKYGLVVEDPDRGQVS